VIIFTATSTVALVRPHHSTASEPLNTDDVDPRPSMASWWMSRNEWSMRKRRGVSSMSDMSLSLAESPVS